ncbi:unnamed protein product, partial [Prunus brigantina]
KKSDEACYKYGMKGHWSRTCRTMKHLVNLYQASIKGKGKEKETNFINFSNIFYDFTEPMDITHLDALDFFANQAAHLAIHMVMAIPMLVMKIRRMVMMMPMMETPIL